MTRLLVLITGTGRSGTSTISGALHHLGLSVPGPYLRANESNPKGFFESSWAVTFHKKISKAAGIIDFDSRPDAFEKARAAITPALREELTAFLTEQSADQDQVAVKDPRSVWAQALWREAAADAGLETRYLSMLRHPAEVIGSRTTYYGPDEGDAEERRRYASVNIARWVNHSLISEHETRGWPRSYVRYTDLLADWRTSLARVRDELGLTYDPELVPGQPHPVDDFVDPDLRRHEHTWSDLDVPTALEQIAQSAWEDLSTLADAGGAEVAASTRLDGLRRTYAQLFEEAAAVTQDAAAADRELAFAAGVAEAEARQRALSTVTPLERRPVSDVPGRDLLRIAGRRATRILRRR